MKRLYLLQALAGSVVLLTIACAEGAARLLSAFPSSMLLWYINLEVFKPLQHAATADGPLRAAFGPLTGIGVAGLWVALLILYRMRQQFGLAVMSHVCLIITAALGGDWITFNRDVPGTASLDPYLGSVMNSGPDAVVMIPLIVAAITAAFASHATILIGNRAPRPQRAKHASLVP